MNYIIISLLIIIWIHTNLQTMINLLYWELIGLDRTNPSRWTFLSIVDHFFNQSWADHDLLLISLLILILTFPFFFFFFFKHYLSYSFISRLNEGISPIILVLKSFDVVSGIVHLKLLSLILSVSIPNQIWCGMWHCSPKTIDLALECIYTISNKKML